jgi:hypothetical protein
MAAWRRQAAAPVFASSALAQPVGRPSLSAASCSAAHAVAFATMLFHLCPPPFFFCSHGFAICRCSRMRARLPLPRVLLPHTCTQDGWFLQPKRRPVRLPRRTVPSNCICGVVECAPASLSPASSSLRHCGMQTLRHHMLCLCVSLAEPYRRHVEVVRQPWPGGERH